MNADKFIDIILVRSVYISSRS